MKFEGMEAEVAKKNPGYFTKTFRTMRSLICALMRARALAGRHMRTFYGKAVKLRAREFRRRTGQQYKDSMRKCFDRVGLHS